VTRPASVPEQCLPHVGYAATLPRVPWRSVLKPQVAMRREVWLCRNTTRSGTDVVKGSREPLKLTPFRPNNFEKEHQEKTLNTENQIIQELP
jgi:hypothetical protein